MTKREAFTKEFEQEALRLALTSGWTRRELAENLGVGLSTLPPVDRPAAQPGD
jgi:transposase